jgi:TP901 family phage tail tape measure protein
MASRIDIPISYSPGSIDQILKDFDTIIKQADISDVFAKDQDKIRAQFATIAETIQKQLGSGKIDLTQVNFTGLEKNIEDFARKVAFVLNEAFEKEVEPYAKKITAITDQIVNKQKELADLNQQMADIGGKERDDFKAKYGLSRMPTLDKGEAKRRLGTAEEELKADSGNTDLQKKVELYRELLEMLSTEKQRKKDIQEQISKKEVDVLNLTNQKKAVQINLDKAQAKLGVDAANYSQKLLDLNRLLIVAKENGIDLSEEQIKLLKEQAEATEKDTATGKKNEKGLIARAGASFSYGLILGQLRQAFRATLTTVLELDKAMTEAAIVTEMNREEAYKLLATYQQLARETGLATSEISGIVVEFLKQGRTMAEAMELARVAAMSAKVAGIDAREAVDYLTAAVNGFQLAANKAGDIADKFSAIAAASATDFEELAIAMSKVAPVAYTAGVGVDFMMGVLAKGLETTREAPENIGTAFKTIFARMREVTDIGKATEDGMSLNRVEKALESIGVPLRDVTGQFRNLENVLVDVGNKWDTLTSIEQAYIATALAGTRQQPRLLAIFNDFARTKELIELSSEATGQLAFQHIEYMEGAAAALAGLKTAWEGFIMAFTDTKLVIDSIRIITDVLNGLNNFFESIGDTSMRNAALIGLVGMAFVAMMPKYASNIAIQIQDIAVKEQLKQKTREVQIEYENLSQSIMKATGAQREQLIAQRQTLIKTNGVSLSMKNMGKSFVQAAGSMALALGKILIWTIAISAAIYVIDAIVKAIQEANLSVDQLANRIQKNNKELNDLETKEKNVEKLTKRFEELNRKVVKTSQDLDQLKNIAEELGTVTVGEKEFNIVRKDVTGQEVIDMTAYDNFLREVDLMREKLLQENIDTFERATKGNIIKLEKALADNPTLMSTARDIGHDFGINFLNGMVDEGFSQTSVNKALENLQRAMGRIDPLNFLTATNAEDVIGNFTGFFSNILYKPADKDAAENILRSLIEDVPASAEEARARIEEAFKSVNKGNMLSDVKRNFVDDVFNAFKNINFEFDEDKARQFSEEMSGLFLQASTMAEREIAALSNATTEQVLTANLRAYQEAIKEINSAYGENTPEANLRINLLKESMQDEAILDMFMSLEKDGQKIYDMSFIVKVIESGTSLTKLSLLVNNFRNELAKTDLTLQEQEDSMLDYNEALSLAFGEDKYDEAYALINDIFGKGSQEAAIQINALSSALNLLNSTTAATELTDQGKNVQDLLKLPEQIAKGDFSKYSDMVAAFGFDTVDKLLKGGTSSLTDFFKENKEEFEEEINKSIANIEAQFYATNEAGKALGDAEKEQIAQLQLMLKYYDQIAGVEQFRAAKVKEVKDLLKETNDLYALQEKLSKGGMSANNPFMMLLDKITSASESEALSKLGTQLQADITKLNSLGKFVNGEFLRNPNVDISESELASKNMMETLTQLIDIQTASYNKQAKVIEERYKTELDAIKSAHDEKWSQIDFNNKLLETEEKIIDARRQLMGLALSGAMRGEYKDAQKALENLQREREKTIETQMLDDAQKQLEQQRNDDLIKAQTAFTAAIEGYTNTITGLAPIVNPGIQTRVTPEDIAIKFDKTTVSLDMLKATMDQLSIDGILESQKTGELIDVNGLMIDEMAELIQTIENWKIQMNVTKSTSGANTDGIGT